MISERIEKESLQFCTGALQITPAVAWLCVVKQTAIYSGFSNLQLPVCMSAGAPT